MLEDVFARPGGKVSIVTDLEGVVQAGFVVRLCGPDPTLLAELQILHGQAFHNKVPIQPQPILWRDRAGLRDRWQLVIARGKYQDVWHSAGPRSGDGDPLAQSTHQPNALKPRVVKSRQRGSTAGSRVVIHKSTIALGDEKDTLDVERRILREVILKIHHTGPGRKISHP